MILTHQHIDHLGLASIVAAHSGAQVAAIDAAVPFVENFSEEAQADDDFARDIMLRHGIPEDVVAALQSVSGAFRAWGARVHVTTGRCETARRSSFATALVHHRPGHSPTDTVFHDRERRILIADHLLGHISSNPMITRPRDGSAERPPALMQYLDSLAATREMDVDLALPGHGDPITAALWGNIAVTQADLTLSEVLGHTDLLMSEGRAGRWRTARWCGSSRR